MGDGFVIGFYKKNLDQHNHIHREHLQKTIVNTKTKKERI